jgi:hypothetical protein
MERKAEDVIRMFKYLLLENYYKLFDRDLLSRTKTDMLLPGEKLIKKQKNYFSITIQGAVLLF